MKRMISDVEGARAFGDIVRHGTKKSSAKAAKAGGKKSTGKSTKPAKKAEPKSENPKSEKPKSDLIVVKDSKKHKKDLPGGAIARGSVLPDKKGTWKQMTLPGIKAEKVKVDKVPPAIDLSFDKPKKPNYKQPMLPGMRQPKKHPQG